MSTRKKAVKTAEAAVQERVLLLPAEQELLRFANVGRQCGELVDVDRFTRGVIARAITAIAQRAGLQADGKGLQLTPDMKSILLKH